VAAVVAHEMGHHVQNLVGSRLTYSVQKELEADCFAGVYMAYAHWDGWLDNGDVNEAYEMFGAIGDELDVYHDAHHGTGQ
jgi:predicted metalloprotease